MTDRGGPDRAREASLAEQAAAWVPPWERARTPAPAEPESEPEPAASAESDPEPEPDPEPAASVESDLEPEPAASAEPDPTGETEPATAESDGVAETEPAATVESHGVAEPEPAEEPELAAEADTISAAEAIGEADDLTAPEEQDPLAAAALLEAPPDAELVDLIDPDAAPADSAAEVAGPAPSRVSHADEEPPTALAVIDEDEFRGALEAIMLVVDEPVQEIVLAQILEQPTERVAQALEAISAGYTTAGHGFELRRAAGGWRLYTRPQYAAYVERFVLDGQSVRLTQAALETLAVIAYKQPVTRGRISAIRGVNCDGVVRTLTSRGLIEEAGTEPETGAYLYRTTTLFLEKLGLDTVDQLPDLAPFLPDDVDEVADGER